MKIERGGISDLIFSSVFVIAAVVIGGFALKAIWIDMYIPAGILFLVSIYFFGIGCMGFYRLSEYAKGNKLCDE